MRTQDIKISFKDEGYRPYFSDESDSRNVYRVFVSYNGKKISFLFGDSLHNTENNKTPMSHYKEYRRDILEIITSDYYCTLDYYPTYSDFAKEFGYDADSIKGLKLYKRCIRQGDKLHKLFSDSDMQYIQKVINH